MATAAALGDMGMRVVLRRLAMGCPARMADAGCSGERRAIQHGFQIFDLSLGAAAIDMAVHQGGNAGRIVAAISQPLQPIDQEGRCRLLAEDADDSAHGPSSLPSSSSLSTAGTW